MLKDLLAESAKQFEQAKEILFGFFEEYHGVGLAEERDEVIEKYTKLFSAQISSAFALGEQSGIKKAVEIVESKRKMVDENYEGWEDALVAVIEALQSNLTTPEGLKNK